MALPPSKVIGCDFSGTVTSLGSAVHPSFFAPDDRIAGIIHGCHYSYTGAFAEYLVAYANLCFKVPDRVPLKEVCMIGVGWISAMQALHQRLYGGDDGSSLGENDTVEHNFSWSPVS
jgi:NADPH:quinone reductase-like Zn-dependent oxidoreductase